MRKARAFQPGQTLKSPSLEATAHIRASENVDDASSSRPAAVAGGSADVDAAAGAGGRTPAAHTQVRERLCVCVVERGGGRADREMSLGEITEREEARVREHCAVMHRLRGS